MSCSKRRRLLASPDWSNMEFDLLETVLKRMSYVDVLSVQAVCSSWLSIAKAYISSSFLKKPLVFALFPKNGKVYLSSSSNAEKLPVLAPFFDNCKEDEERSCFGSSLGWFFLLDKNTNLVMTNLFIRVHVKLPPLSTLPGFYHNNDFHRDRWISKSILSCDPTSGGEYVVVVIYGGISQRLAYSMRGDVTKWTTLEGTYDSYRDIIWYKGHLYAISEDFELEVWEFKGPTPIKKTMTVDLSLVENIEEFETSKAYLYSHRAYLVESLGEILLIVRLIGDYVRIQDGVVVREEDMLNDEELSHVDCEYRTMKFYVYKLDLEENKWVKVESLGDQMLFLGLNQSVSLSAQDFQQHKRNSIYFADDFWDMHLLCGELNKGHDMGVYELDNGNISRLRSCDFDFEPACWVVHNPGTIR